MSFPECPVCSPFFAALGVLSAEVGGVLELLGLLGSSQPWINPKLYEPVHGIQGALLGTQAQVVLSQGSVIPEVASSLPHRSPDFDTGTINVGGIFGGTVHATVDSYGHVYFGGGLEVGKSRTIVPGSLTAGYLNQRQTPTPAELREYLTGVSCDASLGYWIGVDESYTFSSKTSGTSAGFVTPQEGQRALIRGSCVNLV